MMKYYRKLVFIFLCTFAVSASASAFPSDTTDIELLKAKAVAALTNLIRSNRAFIKDNKTDSLNFVVEVGNEQSPPADSAIYLRQVPGVHIPFMGTTKHAELNTYLKQVFQQEGIACYMVFISYFDYKLNIRLSDNERITGIIAYTNKFDELKKNAKTNPQIEKLKVIHRKISSDVYNSIPKDHPFVFMDIGKYCRPEYRRDYISSHCDYIGMHYFYNIPADLKPHLKALMNEKFNGSYEDEPSDNEVAERNTYSLAAAVIQSKLKKQILTTDNQDDLCELLSASNYPFDHTTFVSSAYGSLTLEERIHAIKVFLDGWYVGGSLAGCNAEQKIIAVVKNTPPEQIDSFLLRLETDSILSEMVSDIDDFGPGGNNYESLLKTFSELVTKSPTFDQRIMELHNPYTGAFRSFIWDKSYTFSLVHTPVGTNKYYVDILENQMVEIYRSYVKEWRLTGYQAKSDIPLYEEVWVKDEDPALLHPFDLILFIDHSRLGLIDGGNVGGELGIAIMPAVFMKYAEDKKFNANALKGFVIALDVATLVVGPGAIYKAFQIGNKIRMALLVADFVNAGLNLVLNTSDIEDPRFAAALDTYNKVMFAIGISRITVSGLARLPAVASQMADWATTLSKQTVKTFLITVVALRTQLKIANFDLIEFCKRNKSAEKIFAMEDYLRKEWVRRFPGELLDIANNLYNNVKPALQNVVRTRAGSRAEELLEVLNNNAALRQAMDVENGLIDAWAKVKNLTQHSDDVNFLRSYGIVEREAGVIHHIFSGNVRGGVNISGVTGVHHYTALTTKTSGFVRGEIRIKPGTQTPADAKGLYSGEVEVFDGTTWRPKPAPGTSTFFPANMTKDQIIEELAYAHSKGLIWQGASLPSNVFQGTSSNGITIRFFIGPKLNSAPVSNPTGAFISAFPIQ